MNYTTKKEVINGQEVEIKVYPVGASSKNKAPRTPKEPEAIDVSALPDSLKRFAK